jgi:uncharacterized protein (TIGR00299 family) protein
MRLALLEPFAGVAGDMFVGALIHAGASIDTVRDGLAGIGVDVRCEPALRGGVAARHFEVLTREEDPPRRTLADILELLEGSDLDRAVVRRARTAFDHLARAEAKIHGISKEEVHFHEVGALDSIADVVGAALAFEDLRLEAMFCRALPLSVGTIETAHGILPVPAPAALELIRGRPTVESGLEGELITPTGAALVSAWAELGPPPSLVPEAIGYGAGTRDPEGYPNVCRVTVGDGSGMEIGDLYELVCDVDDADAQLLGHLLVRVQESGALDAGLLPLQMKKGRPGTRVTALVRAASVPAVERVLFVEGSTLGVRRRKVERTELPRRFETVETEFGPVRIKIGELGGEIVHAAPEYEDCRERAEERGVALREVMQAALARWRS